MPTEAEAAVKLAAQAAQREKYWTERDRDEKFEALRENLVQLFYNRHQSISNQP